MSRRFISLLAASMVACMIATGCNSKGASTTSTAQSASSAQSTPTESTSNSQEASAKASAAEATAQAEPAKEEPTSEISPDFKAAMDSYEAFFDEYVGFMQRYKENPTDMELLSEMGDMLSREDEMLKEFDAWESKDLNTAEMAYYLEVQGRIYKKLGEVR